MFLTALISGLSALSQTAIQPCPGDAQFCWQEGEDIILANSEEAAIFLPHMQEARGRFETLHGFEAPDAALVFDNINQAELREAGYEVILPWLMPSSRDAIMRESIENSVRSQTEGLPEAQVQAILEQALEQAGLSVDASITENEAALVGAAMHELGHLWFLRSFDWPVLENTTDFYGADTAPDWLDEVGAVLLENEYLTENRRAHLAEVWREENDAQLVSLAHYFSIDHPLLAGFMQQEAVRERARALAAENGGSGVVTVQLTAEEARERLAMADGMDPALFYAQSRGFIDYVVARSGSEQYFVDATRALVNGAEFTSWHHAHAAQYSLPSDIELLQADWEIWLEETYGEAEE